MGQVIISTTYAKPYSDDVTENSLFYTLWHAILRTLSYHHCILYHMQIETSYSVLMANDNNKMMYASSIHLFIMQQLCVGQLQYTSHSSNTYFKAVMKIEIAPSSCSSHSIG